MILAAGEPARESGWAGRLREPLVLGAVVLGLGAATVAAALLTNGNAGVTAAPVLLAVLLYAVCRAHLRYTALVLIFLLLGLDDLNTALGLWHTPWAFINPLLVLNVDRMIPAAHGFKLSALELLLFLGFGLAIHRRATQARVDGSAGSETARVLLEFTVVYLLGIAWATVNGLVLRHGSPDIAIAQARPLLRLIMLFFFFDFAFRADRDLVAVARVVVLSALAKAALALFVYLKFKHRGEVLACATSHGDSFLFVMACVIPAAHFMERTDRKRLLRLAWLIPVLFAGIWANSRRLAWLQLGFALLGVFLLSRERPWKRWTKRAVALAAPILLLYVAAGWNSSSALFAPVRTLRSVQDTKNDRSTYFRQVENYNLAMGMRFYPVRGLGFGHEFAEFYPMDDITGIFPQYHAEPHNQVLGLLLFAGLAGFAAIWSLLAMGVFLAARAYRKATDHRDRVAALCCYAAIIAALIDTYGDLGPYNTQHQVLVALALAIGGKLAVSTGAWARKRRPGRLSANHLWREVPLEAGREA